MILEAVSEFLLGRIVSEINVPQNRVGVDTLLMFLEITVLCLVDAYIPACIQYNGINITYTGNGHLVVSVCLSVHAVRKKQLELLTPRSVEALRMH